MQTDYPVWQNSKVPPSITKHLNGLNSVDRRYKLADLIASYELKLSTLTPTAKQMMRKWALGQDKHLRGVIEELNDMLALETSGTVARGGEVYLNGK